MILSYYFMSHMSSYCLVRTFIRMKIVKSFFEIVVAVLLFCLLMRIMIVHMNL